MHDSVVGLMSACADVNESLSLRDIKQFLLHLCKEQREIVLFLFHVESQTLNGGAALLDDMLLHKYRLAMRRFRRKMLRLFFMFLLERFHNLLSVDVWNRLMVIHIFGQYYLV